LQAYSAAKCDCGQGSALDLVGGAYSTFQTTLAGFKNGRFTARMPEGSFTCRKGGKSKRGEKGQGDFYMKLKQLAHSTAAVYRSRLAIIIQIQDHRLAKAGLRRKHVFNGCFMI